jgi:peptidoglycan hydrolase-like protein with peptidoglycan-binding domain
MSDPSILLLLTCITCADSTDGFTHLSASDCSTVESFSQSQRPTLPEGRLVNCTHSISAPEAIPAFLTTASQPAVTVQTTAPEPFILPETFTKSPAANSTPANPSANPSQVSLPLNDLPDLLMLGSQGEAVSRLQQELQRLEYYTGPIDGIYGQLTYAAVTKFQQAEGLAVDGIAGSLTWSRLQTLAIPAIASMQPHRQATAILEQNDASAATPLATTKEQPSNTGQPLESASLEDSSTAGEIAENAPVSEVSQVSQSQDIEAESEPPPSNQEPQQTDFVLDTSPNGVSFYFWIGAWAIVYIGGMLFIFKNNIISKLGLTWGNDDREQQDIHLPLFESSLTDQFTAVLDSDPTPDSSDGFGPIASDPAGQEKRNLMRQNGSLHFSRELDIPSEVEKSPTDAKPPKDLGKPPLISLLEKLAYEGPRRSNQQLTPVWADGGVVEPLRGLFSDLPHPLGSQPSERRRNRAAMPPHPATIQSVRQNPQADVPSTLIATLPDEDPETKNSYTYALLDNAEGYFLLKGNELRIYDGALAQIESDVDHTIVLRRTDAEGVQVDKSFVVSFTKAEDDDAAEMARSA